MFQTWKIFSSIKSFSVGHHSVKKSKHTFQGRKKIKFLKFQHSSNLILAPQKLEMSKCFSLFLNGRSQTSKSFLWRRMNLKEYFISTNILFNLRDIAPITNFMSNIVTLLSPMNEYNIDYKNQKANLKRSFSAATELVKPFQISTTNAYNYNFFKRNETICRNGNKNNYMSLFNKHICFCGTYLWHNSYDFKNYSKNIKELESKQTKQLFTKQWAETEPIAEKQLTRKQKLKAAIKDYGVTVIVFHVVISLISLGVCYLIVISGFDYSQTAKVEENAATVETAAKFVVAYAIHKALAPARIGITLATAPFIVKKLRKIGILKPPKS